MTRENKMTCPDCGVELKHHALKLDYSSSSLEEPPGFDPDLGGVLEEIHSCPECGKTETRVISSQ